MADNVILGQYGITQLTGDVLAGPGIGSQAATISGSFNPFDQDLNTTDDVEFGTLSIGNLVTTPDTGQVFQYFGNTTGMEFFADTVQMACFGTDLSGRGLFRLSIDGNNVSADMYGYNKLNSHAPFIEVSGSDETLYFSPNGTEIMLQLTATNLTIGGSNGVTAGPFTNITSIQVKNGIVIGLTGS